VVKSRLDIYHEQTEPLKAYYEKTGKLKLVVGQVEVADTTRLTFETIDGGLTGR
jgi:adenylate kinase